MVGRANVKKRTGSKLLTAMLLAPLASAFAADKVYYLSEPAMAALLGGTVSERIIATQFAMRVWTSYGSTANGISYGGVTTQTGCGPVNIVDTVNGICGAACPVACNCTRALWSVCPTGTERIAINTVLQPPTTGVSLAPTSEVQIDYQALLAHEFGHALGLTHNVANPTNIACTMNPTYRTLEGRGFCQFELQRIESEIGTAANRINVLRRAGNPPPVASWTSLFWGPHYIASTGIGLASAESGNVSVIHQRDTLFVANRSGGGIYSCDWYYGDSWPPNVPCIPVATSPAMTTRHRLGTAYDPTRSRWWVFYVHSDNTLHAAFSADRFSWTEFQLEPFGNKTIKTKWPVSAAYDYHSDSIVVAWNQNNENHANGLSPYPADSVVSPFPCNTTFGCSTDINVAIVRADGTTGVFPSANAPPSYRLGTWSTTTFGLSAYGSPAIACDALGTPIAGNFSTYQCEVLFTGNDASRVILASRFAVASNRTVVETPPTTGPTHQLSSPPSSPGGITADQISYTGSPANAFVAALRGMDGLLYINTKSGINGAWNGWWQVTNTSGQTIASPVPPVVRGRLATAGWRWDLSYAVP